MSLQYLGSITCDDMNSCKAHDLESYYNNTAEEIQNIRDTNQKFRENLFGGLHLSSGCSGTPSVSPAGVVEETRCETHILDKDELKM